MVTQVFKSGSKVVGRAESREEARIGLKSGNREIGTTGSSFIFSNLI